MYNTSGSMYSSLHGAGGTSVPIGFNRGGSLNTVTSNSMRLGANTDSGVRNVLTLPSNVGYPSWAQNSMRNALSSSTQPIERWRMSKISNYSRPLSNVNRVVGLEIRSDLRKIYDVSHAELVVGFCSDMMVMNRETPLQTKGLGALCRYLQYEEGLQLYGNQTNATDLLRNIQFLGVQESTVLPGVGKDSSGKGGPKETISFSGCAVIYDCSHWMYRLPHKHTFIPCPILPCGTGLSLIYRKYFFKENDIIRSIMVDTAFRKRLRAEAPDCYWKPLLVHHPGRTCPPTLYVQEKKDADSPAFVGGVLGEVGEVYDHPDSAREAGNLLEMTKRYLDSPQGDVSLDAYYRLRQISVMLRYQ